MTNKNVQVCPRCFENELVIPIERNALSRLDNETYICSECGMDEALIENDGLFEKSVVKILVVKPQMNPAVYHIKNELTTLQGIVDGYIEAISLPKGLVLICNEEGKLKGLQPNRRISGDIIVGTFFFCRSEDGEFTSLNDEDVLWLEERMERNDWYLFFGR